MGLSGVSLVSRESFTVLLGVELVTIEIRGSLNVVDMDSTKIPAAVPIEQLGQNWELPSR